MALWTFCDFARVRLLFALFCVEFASFQRVVSFLSVGCLRSSWGMCQCTYPIFHRSHFGSRYQSGRCALRSPFLKPRCFQTLHVSFSKSSCSVCFFAFVSMGTTHIVPIEALQLMLYPQRLCAFFFSRQSERTRHEERVISTDVCARFATRFGVRLLLFCENSARDILPHSTENFFCVAPTRFSNAKMRLRASRRRAEFFFFAALSDFLMQKAYSTRRFSRAVPHHGTCRALTGSTSEFRWDRVHS